MELSRIMGTLEEERASSESGDDFAMDLERELMGGFDEPAELRSAETETQDDDFAARDFQESIERELPANGLHVDTERVSSVPLAAYEEPDYADYEPDPIYSDSEVGEGAPVESVAAPYEERAVVAAPSLSLEDELENLLAGAAQPAVQRSAHASWGYGSQTQVPGRTEIAPTISRTTPYQQVAPQAVVDQVPEPEPVAYDIAGEQVLDSADEDFDTDELMTAFDDFDVAADQDEESEPVAEADPVFPLYQSVEQSSAPVHEPIAVPVAAPIASAPQLPEVHALSDYADELDRAVSSFSAAPDVHTVSVSENRVDYTESLDLPVVNYEDDVPQHNGLGELENEFAEVFGSIEEDPRGVYAAEEAAKPASEDDEYAEIFADVFGNQADGATHNPAGHAVAAGATAAGMGAARAQQNRTAMSAYGPEDDDLDFAYDPRRDEVDMAASSQVQAEQAVRRRSSLFVPGVAAAVVLLAVAGAVAYKWTGGSNGEPVVIMADKTPIKVQPETASTAAVPNQDKAVYDKSATTAPEAPKQDQLVTTREDPIDLPSDEDEALSAIDAPDADAPVADDKVEARIDPANEDASADTAGAAPNNAIAPRKVQTMVVKPDGTMVASIPAPADPVSAGPAAAPADRPAQADPVGALPSAMGNDEIGDLMQDDQTAAPVHTAGLAPAPAAPVATEATPAPAAGKLPPKPVATKKITPETVASVTPRNIPVVESRPADQPIDIVDRVPPKNAGQQVASAAPAAGSYLIQIASQPNVEGAQKTYASLSQKYAGVIGGRGVDIKQAEIAGKGTFFRVRIPAGSKSDANALCAKYKTAGGSCFVTQ
jgi:hypothetical protein